LDLEKLFDESVEEKDTEKLESFLGILMDSWVYFFLLEIGGKDTPVSSGELTHIILTGKDNSINIPTINNEQGNSGIIYTNKELAVTSAEFNCKVGKMKGLEAFQMFLGISSIDAIYVQSNTCNVHIPKKEINRIVERYA